MNRTRKLSHFFRRVFATLMLVGAAGVALAQVDPPGRVGVITAIEGAMGFAPAGETQWTGAMPNRPITNGDRLHTDAGARAELQLGTAVLHLDGRTGVEVVALDQQAAQFTLTEGSVNARVRELASGENFEIDTPQLALRAAEPGDWRVDVDAGRGFTRVTVHGGAVTLYGGSGVAMRLQAGQQMVFAGRELEPLAGVPAPLSDVFDVWVADRNRAQDESMAARYVPREVVGYQALDRYGSWSRDPAYGAVWYPQVAIADWAPYRYGRWEWIAPWGWTWIDDAPWGFAPFHYGRWATIGGRWAWVPGAIGPRPVYAPALVAFIGGPGWSLAVSSGPGIGWYPLAPGEAWQPFYRASTVYVRNVNRYVVTGHRYPDQGHAHVFQRRPEAITAVPVNDFHRGAPVGRHWARVDASEVVRGHAITPPTPAADGRPGNRGARPGVRLALPEHAAPSQPQARQPEPRRLEPRHQEQRPPEQRQPEQRQPEQRQPETRQPMAPPIEARPREPQRPRVDEQPARQVERRDPRPQPQQAQPQADPRFVQQEQARPVRAQPEQAAAPEHRPQREPHERPRAEQRPSPPAHAQPQARDERRAQEQPGGGEEGGPGRGRGRH